MLWPVIIIFVVIIVGGLIANNHDTISSLNEDDEQDRIVIQEVLKYVESVKSLYVNEHHLNGETLSCFMIIPINENNEMYRPDSCRVLLSLLLDDESDWRVESVLLTAKLNHSMFDEYFHAESFLEHRHFVAYTSWHFSSDYKSFMSKLFHEINIAYPEKFRFDGSRIICVANYGEKIF